MAINKFVDRQGNTLLDLSTDTVSPNRVLAGTTFHGPDGTKQMGTLDPGPMDYSQYNFIDYDGTLLYSYTDEELDALTALPAGPDHTGDNLTFQEWNWTLADLKAWDRTRADRPLVGANYITTDGKSYLYLDTPLSGATLRLEKIGTFNSVDWGDGTVDTNISHIYANPGQYTIVIDMAENGYWYINNNSPSMNTNAQYIRKIKMGIVREFYPSGNFLGCSSLETISIPNNVTIQSSTFYFCKCLKAVVVPKSSTKIGGYAFYYCYSINIISLPNLSNIDGTNNFADCRSLNNIVLPNNISQITNSMFYGTSIKTITIPNSVTSIGNNVFANCYSIENLTIPDSVTSMDSYFLPERPLTLDLSKQTKVITLNGNIGITVHLSVILVPSTLLQNYKSSSQWLDYADIMVGV